MHGFHVYAHNRRYHNLQLQKQMFPIGEITSSNMNTSLIFSPLYLLSRPNRQLDQVLDWMGVAAVSLALIAVAQ